MFSNSARMAGFQKTRHCGIGQRQRQHVLTVIFLHRFEFAFQQFHFLLHAGDVLRRKALALLGRYRLGQLVFGGWRRLGASCRAGRNRREKSATRASQPPCGDEASPLLLAGRFSEFRLGRLEPVEAAGAGRREGDLILQMGEVQPRRRSGSSAESLKLVFSDGGARPRRR